MLVNKDNVFDVDWFGREYYDFNEKSNMSGSFFFDVETDDVQKLSRRLSNFSKGCGNREIPVIVGDKDESYTDGKRIVVSPLGDITDESTKLDTILGLCVHETCHCLFTDFGVVRMLKGSTEKWLLNVIEDENIENTMRIHKNGVGKFLDRVKYHYFDKKFDGDFSKVNEFDEILKILFLVIRYPKYVINNDSYVTREMKNKWGALFVNIYETLKNYKSLTQYGCGYENVTYNNYCSVLGIMRLLEPYMTKENQDEVNQNADSIINKTNDCPNEFEEHEEKCDELEKQFDGYEKKYGRGKGNNRENIRTTTIETYVNQNKNQYLIDKRSMQEFDKCVKNLNIGAAKMRTTQVTTKYQMCGRLAQNQLATAFIGNKFVNDLVEYKKERITDKVAIVVSIDMSGSMSPVLKNVKRVTTFIVENFNKLGYEIFVYTHNSQQVSKIVDNKKLKSNIYSIGGIDELCCCCQDESSAYKTIIDDVKRQTNLPIVFINITDSEYGCTPQDIKNVVETYKKKSVKFALVSLNEKFVNEVNNEIYGNDNYVSTKKLNEKDITKLIKIIKSGK